MSVLPHYCEGCGFGIGNCHCCYIPTERRCKGCNVKIGYRIKGMLCMDCQMVAQEKRVKHIEASASRRNVFFEFDDGDTQMTVAPCVSVPITDAIRREDEIRQFERWQADRTRITWSPPVTVEPPKRFSPNKASPRCPGCGHPFSHCQCATKGKYCTKCKLKLGVRNKSGLCRTCINIKNADHMPDRWAKKRLQPRDEMAGVKLGELEMV